ncbi:MAG: DUF2974 domain-containing protein [Verrucomicrobia bacterium]|nr:DUF2974 domain-containing protein [Verrucomicrobiota bacterium]MBS0637189.1 DUF2974 domain-containing protein [Verrucomicrobiota bacterium]
MDVQGQREHRAEETVPPATSRASPATGRARELATRIGESFKRKAVVVLSPPKSGPGSGLVKRAKSDISLSVRGTLHPADKAHQTTVRSFHSFDVVPRVPFDTPPLTEAQRNKAEELGLVRLLNIQDKPNATRQDFDRTAWKELDTVNFALTQEHLETLCNLFNSPYHEETVQAFKEHGNWNEALVAETLAKALAYTEDLGDKSIKLPVLSANNRYELKEFTIKSWSLGDNLPCYVLSRENEQSWIIPRGTEIATKKTERRELRQGAMESILADCDPKGIAYTVLEKAQKGRVLEELFYDAGDNAIIAGHSLGGLLANELAARFPDKIAHAYGFSAPGISKETYQSLTDKLDTKVTNFQTEGDLVPSAGRYCIGKNFAVSSEAPDAIHAHLQHNLNRQSTRLTVVDNEKENEKLMRRVSEATRKTVGGAILKISTLFKKAPIWAQKNRG